MLLLILPAAWLKSNMHLLMSRPELIAQLLDRAARPPPAPTAAATTGTAGGAEAGGAVLYEPYLDVNDTDFVLPLGLLAGPHALNGGYDEEYGSDEYDEYGEYGNGGGGGPGPGEGGRVPPGCSGGMGLLLAYLVHPDGNLSRRGGVG